MCEELEAVVTVLVDALFELLNQEGMPEIDAILSAEGYETLTNFLAS